MPWVGAWVALLLTPVCLEGMLLLDCVVPVMFRGRHQPSSKGVA